MRRSRIGSLPIGNPAGELYPRPDAAKRECPNYAPCNDSASRQRERSTAFRTDFVLTSPSLTGSQGVGAAGEAPVSRGPVCCAPS